MSCLNPTLAWQDLSQTTKSGKHPVIFSFNELDSRYFRYRYDNEKKQDIFCSRRYRELALPCGQCLLCRKARSWEITVRAIAEMQADPLQPVSFVTLTVDDAHLTEVFPYGLLRHEPWQKFAKRLRKRCGKMRYLMCGEYGEHTLRPHYHAIIYGPKLCEKTWNYDDGSFCESPLIQECWPFGQIRCVPCNVNTIAYVAGYAVKKIDMSRIDSFFVDPPDGVFKEAYVRWSRNPGLGSSFLEKYHDNMFFERVRSYDDGTSFSEISPSLIVNGQERFFDGRFFKQKLELTDPELFGKMQLLNEGRIFGKRLHGPSYDQMIRKARALKNRVDSVKIQLAKRSRDVVA